MTRNKSLGLGVFLLSIGLIWILASVGVITWSIVNAIFVLWPLLLILAGINVIFRNNEIIKSVAWIAFLAIVISYGYFYNEDGITGNSALVEKTVTIKKDAGTESASLKLGMGGSRIYLGSGTTEMLEARIEDTGVTYGERADNGRKIIEFEKKSYRISNLNMNLDQHKSSFYLNDTLPWDITLNTGAADGDFDMSGLIVEKLDISTGASNTRLVFGERSSSVKVNIDAGASKIKMTLPKSVGARVKLEGALNSTSLQNSKWVKRDDTYYTVNYDNSTVKIDMDITMGVGKLDIEFK